MPWLPSAATSLAWRRRTPPRLQEHADGTPVLWLTLGGSDGGSEKAFDRRDRQVVGRIGA